jgi:hypothetical protein
MEDSLMESDDWYTFRRWIRIELEPDPTSSEARRLAYPLSPDSKELRTASALAKAWFCAADSLSATKKCRVVKYDRPPMLKERSSAPRPNMAVMRAPMPT